MMTYILKLYSTYSKAFILALIGFFAIDTALANVAAKQERVRMKLYYEKNDSGERIFTIGLTAGSGRNMHGVKNAEVQLTAVLEDATYVLATLETDTLGEVQIYLAEDYSLPMDEDGYTYIEAIYEGNENYRSASNDITIADLSLEFSFDVEDSIKYLKVIANRINREGSMIPVEELDVNIGIDRLFNVLPLDDVETDEDGIGELEIPNDLPGDAEGNVTFVAKIEDSDDFGTVTKMESYHWGVPVSYEVKPLPRQLFTDEAPLWMIASVMVILLGAWYHFFLSISKLIKLKKAAHLE
jgi:hypothetical protein